MKTLTNFILVIVLILFSFSSFSQFEENSSSKKEAFRHNTESQHALGLSVGGTTGFGLSYMFMPDRFCFQVAFLPYKDQYSTFISAGLTIIYRLREGEKLNFLLYQGNHFITRTESRINYTSPTPNGTVMAQSSKVTTSGFNNGVGFGFEFFLSESVSFNLMGGYAGYNNFERITITGEGALFYKF